MTDELIKNEEPNLTLQQEIAIQQYREVKNLFSVVKSDKTDMNYTSEKNGLLFVDAAYTDEKFSKYFPVYKQELEHYSEDAYWVKVVVSLEVTLPNGMTIKKLAGGGTRKHVTKEAKAAAIAGTRNITPFDYVDLGHAVKGAVTNAVKNAQERFGVNADIANRIIVSPENIEKIDLAIAFIISEQEKLNPMIGSKLITRRLELAKSPYKRGLWLKQICEYFGYNIEEDFVTDAFKEEYFKKLKKT